MQIPDELRGRMDWAINNAQPMLWSNFLVTINSNVRPLTLPQRIGMTQWLRDGLETLFSDFDLLNGRVLKPAGSPNDEDTYWTTETSWVSGWHTASKRLPRRASCMPTC